MPFLPFLLLGGLFALPFLLHPKPGQPGQMPPGPFPPGLPPGPGQAPPGQTPPFVAEPNKFYELMALINLGYDQGQAPPQTLQQTISQLFASLGFTVLTAQPDHTPVDPTLAAHAPGGFLWKVTAQYVGHTAQPLLPTPQVFWVHAAEIAPQMQHGPGPVQPQPQPGQFPPSPGIVPPPYGSPVPGAPQATNGVGYTMPNGMGMPNWDFKGNLHLDAILDANNNRFHKEDQEKLNNPGQNVPNPPPDAHSSPNYGESGRLENSNNGHATPPHGVTPL